MKLTYRADGQPSLALREIASLALTKGPTEKNPPTCTSKQIYIKPRCIQLSGTSLAEKLASSLAHYVNCELASIDVSKLIENVEGQCV